MGDKKILGIERRQKQWQSRWYFIGVGFVAIAVGLVHILSFGSLTADWTLRYCFKFGVPASANETD